MNIGIVDADLIDKGTRHPNLALMKISGYYKNKGHEVNLLTNYDEFNNYDKIFISKVFDYTKVPPIVFNHENVTRGGTGFYEDGGESLPDEIERHFPDYTLYNDYVNSQIELGKNKNNYSDYLDYSIGFTTRGCFRKCEFCVNKKYDKAVKHAPVTEFLDESRKAIYLWDDNFLAYPGWESILDDLESTNKPFQFRQGLDIRLLTTKSASRLSKTKYNGDFIFAFDHIEERDLIERKLKLWRRHTAKTTKLYVFCAYDSQDIEDITNVFERIKILMKYGCLPYIMRYMDYKNSEFRGIYTQIARWCNQPQFFKKKSFREFCIANQEYHKNKDTNCAAYQAMIDFEDNYPQTAKEYFDLRFEEVNLYSSTLGFGRRYPNKEDCIVCKNKEGSWIDGMNNEQEISKVIKRYFCKDLDLQCLSYKNNLCSERAPSDIAIWFSERLISTSVLEILNLIRNQDRDSINPSNIPQFSNFTDSIINVPKILEDCGKEFLSYDEMGYFLDGKDRKLLANKKYGENHAKLATLLDLAYIIFPRNSARISLSEMGKVYNRLNPDKQNILLVRLALRIPIIQSILIDGLKNKISVDDYLFDLSYNTSIRRRTNVISILRFIELHSGNDLFSIFNNIKEV